MIYKPFHELQLSALGLGCMRLPEKDGAIDEALTAEMVKKAMESGINYYDTAWGYHSGQSEVVMGKILKDYPRDSFYIATKFPGFDTANMERVEEIFNKQLEKLQMDRFDFYLYHNVSEGNIDGYLDPKYGIQKYLMEQKAAGRIGHLGFSAHGNLDTMRRFLEAYGKDMEFCQIQLNWLDWSYQDAKAKVELLKEYNIPVWVMEPVRGGALVDVAEADAAKLNALRPDTGIPGWAFRFIQSLPEVVVTLSGMSNMAQLEDNLATFAEDKPLNAAEWDTLQGIAKEMIARNTVPCTACRYCVDKCTAGLSIPDLMKMYNFYTLTGAKAIRPQSYPIAHVPEEKRPSACLSCRACEAVCPQNIKIADIMANFASRIGG